MKNEAKEIENLQTEYTKLPAEIWLKAIGYTLFFLFFFIIISIFIASSFACYKVNQFRVAAKMNWGELTNTAIQIIEREPLLTKNGRKNILLLGVDEIANRENHPIFTDTIILLSIDLSSGKIYSLPIPRDLWSAEYKTKINALYIYGKDRYPEEPERFSREIVSQMTGQEIQHSLILSLDQLAQIIDLVDGVEIEIQESFTDDKFPRSDVDISSKDESILYETITFIKGNEKMSGERALKYIRSRHSIGDEGSDLARSKRQQQVISALINKLSDFSTLKNTKLLGELYLFYLDNFDKYLNNIELAATLKKLVPVRNSVEFSSLSLAIYPTDEAGVIIHPDPKDYDDQWVYIIENSEKLKTEIKEKLNL